MIDQGELVLSHVVADSLSALRPSGTAMSIDDATGSVERALRALGMEVRTWHRHAGPDVEASACPPAGPFDLITLRLPKSRESLEMAMHLAGGRLAAGGQLIVYGTNDEGIKSVARPMAALMGSADVLDARRHSRVLRSVLPEHAPVFRARLEDWRVRVQDVRADETAMEWVSYPGVFAHGRLDDGTRALLETLPVLEPGRRALDYGCGVGLIAAELLRRCPNAAVDMADHDAVALQAARENVPAARALLGDGWCPVEPRHYDLIASNPPIHRRMQKDFRLLQEFLDKARSHVSSSGAILFVVQRAAPTADILEEAGLRHEIASENTRFRVWRARLSG